MPRAERDGEETELALVLSTAPDAATAERIARALVEERLIACASLVPGVTSVYRWAGEVHADPELLLLIKTRRALLPRVTDRIAELHPYEVPEVVSAPVEHALAAYCAWVREETEGEPQRGGASLPPRGTTVDHGAEGQPDGRG